jgi:hypothetical protein
MITVAIVAGDEDRVTVALSCSGERRSEVRCTLHSLEMTAVRI